MASASRSSSSGRDRWRRWTSASSYDNDEPRGSSATRRRGPYSSAVAARFPNAARERERDAPATTAEGGWGGGSEVGGEAEVSKEKGRRIKKKEREGADMWGPQVVVRM
jgi:hypothetical protein